MLLLNTDRARPFEVDPGDRIAQLVVTPFAAAEPVEAVDAVELRRQHAHGARGGPRQGRGRLRLQRPLSANSRYASQAPPPLS